MGLEAKLSLRMNQQLLMTPQLQQAIKLLQLGRLDYIDAIQQEILENPLLEEVPEHEPLTPNAQPSETTVIEMSETLNTPESQSLSTTEEPTPTAKEAADWADFLEDLAESRTEFRNREIDTEERPSLEATLTKGESLQEFILKQVFQWDEDEQTKRIAAEIVGNLDKDGFLRTTVEELVAVLKVQAEEIECVLKLVQELDPIGIGARNLNECLLIQLARLGQADGLASVIVTQHLEKVEKRKLDIIAKETGRSLEDVKAAIEIIRSLEPHPGRQFADEEPRYIVPDIYIVKDGKEYVVSVNDDGMPKLRISNYYLSVLRSNEETGPGGSAAGGKGYLNERLKAATWLIKSMHQRQSTIFKVTQSIVKFQREFLEHGISRLKPLVLRDVADDIGMHESTVSRVTTSKYVHTPQGVYELKFFFTNGLPGNMGDVSSAAIKERIKNIIQAESAAKPVSDQELSEILKKENIEIARRTIAKYRESLGIPSSSLRKSSG